MIRYSHLNHIQHINTGDTVSLVANIVTIFGVIGLVIAYIEYRNKLKEDKKAKIENVLNIIASVKSQLKTIGHWTNYDGGGYKNENANSWTIENYIERSNPFHKTYRLDYSYLKNVSILPGIWNVNEGISQSLAWLIQWCSNFNSFLEEIENFKYSRPAERNMILNKKFSDAILNSSSREVFYNSLDSEERLFTDMLLNMYVKLHFDVISSNEGRKLHFWHKRLFDSLELLETTKKQELSQI